MGSIMLGALLALLSAQADQPAGARRLPFETGQLRYVTSVRDDRQCAATSLGRGYESFAGTLCEAGATQPRDGGLRTLLVSFTRAGEREAALAIGPGRRLYDLEAEVSLDSSGVFGACRLIREQGAPRLYFFGRGRGCDALRNDVALFAATDNSGLRQGRLRISIFVDALPAEIDRLLGPPPMVVVTQPPPMMAPAVPALPPPPAPPMLAPAGSRPVPIDRHIWFTADDYPAASLRAEDEGMVTARLEVSPQGRVVACTVIESSGSASLDMTACRIFRARARYQPARDARGRPVASATTDRVHWRLPEAELLLREPAYAALSIGMRGDMRTHCDTLSEAPIGNGLAALACQFIVLANEDLPPAVGQGDGALRITLEVVRKGVPRPDVTREQGTVIFATSALFPVQPDGGMGDCANEVSVAPRAPGVPPFDFCAVLRAAGSPLFSPGADLLPGPTRIILTVLEGGPP